MRYHDMPDCLLMNEAEEMLENVGWTDAARAARWAGKGLKHVAKGAAIGATAAAEIGMSAATMGGYGASQMVISGGPLPLTGSLARILYKPKKGSLSRSIIKGLGRLGGNTETNEALINEAEEMLANDYAHDFGDAMAHG